MLLTSRWVWCPHTSVLLHYVGGEWMFACPERVMSDSTECRVLTPRCKASALGFRF